MADIEFKTKGYFGGTYNAISGAIRNEKTGETLFELSGMWSGEMTMRNVAVGLDSGCFQFGAGLTDGTDWTEGAPLQCHKRKTYAPDSQTPRGARGP